MVIVLETKISIFTRKEKKNATQTMGEILKNISAKISLA